MDWKTQRVVVVGGSSGIGLEVARAALRRGAEAHIAGRSAQRLDAAKTALKSDRVHTHALDFTREAMVRGVFESIGKFHHLVITAAQGAGGLFADLDTEAVREVFEGKFMGQYITAKVGARHIEGSGSITFFSSLAGHRAMPGLSAIASMNGAIEALARTLAVELKPIRVNAVVPGVVDTPAHAWMTDTQRSAWYAEVSKLLPVGRVGRPDEVAHAVMFLMDNTFVTGSSLRIDGGHSVV